jgi:hypothetical protein
LQGILGKIVSPDARRDLKVCFCTVGHDSVGRPGLYVGKQVGRIHDQTTDRVT